MAVKTTYFFGSYSSVKPFIITVNSGADSSFTIPTTGGGYNYKVSTSDGQNFTGVTGSLTITFPNANTLYDVSISGSFPRIFFNNGTQRLKLIDIKQWGDIEWTSMGSAFNGCSNTTCTATDVPNLQGVNSVLSMFYRCSLFDADINNYNYSSIEDIRYFINQCLAFNKEINIQLPNVVDSRSLLAGTTSLIKPVKIEYDKFVLVFEIITESAAKDIELIFNNGCNDFGANCFRNTNPDRLILSGATGSFRITYFGSNFDSVAIDNLFTSLGTANTGATITITTAQSTSGIDTTIATSKGWTIVIV